MFLKSKQVNSRLHNQVWFFLLRTESSCNRIYHFPQHSTKKRESFMRHVMCAFIPLLLYKGHITSYTKSTRSLLSIFLSFLILLWKRIRYDLYDTMKPWQTIRMQPHDSINYYTYTHLAHSDTYIYVLCFGSSSATFPKNDCLDSRRNSGRAHLCVGYLGLAICSFFCDCPKFNRCELCECTIYYICAFWFMNCCGSWWLKGAFWWYGGGRAERQGIGTRAICRANLV